MHVLFVHKNFPAQFGYIARHLVKAHGFECTFVSQRPPGDAGGVRRIQYRLRGAANRQTHFCSRSFENFTWHSHAVYDAMKSHPEVKPDLVVGHSGFGSTLFLADLYDCPIINYFEWYYHAGGADFDFRPEFPSHELMALRARSRNAMLLADLENCATGYCPTQWQRSQMPEVYQHKLRTLFDGIDTSLWRPDRLDPSQPRKIGDRTVPPGMKIVTYVSRGFESLRGFDIFMKVAKRICDRRKDVVFACVGSDRVCYGGDLQHVKERSFREHVLANDEYDLERILFLGTMPTNQLADLLNLSDLHIYLTAPFILSWSLMNSLSCGCTVLASDTEPVREMIDHGRNGLLAPFFDVDGLVAQAMQVLDDPAAFQALGTAGADMIRERYSLAKVVPEMLEMYESVSAPDAQGEMVDERPHDISSDDEGIMSGIEHLRAEYAWPTEKPDVTQCADMGWMRRPHRDVLAESLNGETRVVIELGAWTGLSTRALAGHAPDAVIISAEQWNTDVVEREGLEEQWPLPGAFRSFLSNCWDYRDRVIPISASNVKAMEMVHRAGIQPNAIYMRCSHATTLEDDLRIAQRLFPESLILGENWRWLRVQKAIQSVLVNAIFEIEVRGNMWKIWRANSQST